MLKWIINNPASFISIVTGIGTTSWLGIKKLLASVRKQERKRINALTNRRFVIDMAQNHLPHQYHALELIAKNLGIILPEPPPIRFASPIDINGEDTDEDLL
jgi:hypothetical protein